MVLKQNVTYNRINYNILRRKVLKVYHYDLYTKSKLLEIENDLENIQKRRKKRKYTQKISRFLKEDLSEELKKLTRSEGNILVKLIYRETKISTYSLVKKYRGSANAFFWQSLPRLYDNNLKQIYDPKNSREDMFIIDKADILTISESQDVHMISMFQQFVEDSDKMKKGEPKLSRKMGYISNVRDAKDILEKLYKSS